jgi:hypothetical protein
MIAVWIKQFNGLNHVGGTISSDKNSFPGFRIPRKPLSFFQPYSLQSVYEEKKKVKAPYHGVHS